MDDARTGYLPGNNGTSVTDKSRERSPRPGEINKKMRLHDAFNASKMEAVSAPTSNEGRALRAFDELFGKLFAQKRGPKEISEVTYGGCKKSAVCWDWALFGATEQERVDPRISEDPFNVAPHNNCSEKNIALQKMLTAIGFEVDNSSDLKIVAYFDSPAKGQETSNPVWEHIEFVYKDFITITKGLEEDLKANTGSTPLEGRIAIEVGVKPGSLTAAHLDAIEELAKGDIQRLDTSD